MKTACNVTRRELMASRPRVTDAAARHLAAGCEECGGFARRLAAARAGLRGHRAHVEPDAGFAARVGAALPSRGRERDDLSWAALRLLPATLGLALVLGLWSWWGTASPTDLAATAPTDDVLAWVLDSGSDS